MVEIDIELYDKTRKEYRHNLNKSAKRIIDSDKNITIEFREQLTRSFNNKLGTYRKWIVYKDKKPFYLLESFFSIDFSYTNTFTSPFNQM